MGLATSDGFWLRDDMGFDGVHNSCDVGLGWVIVASRWCAEPRVGKENVQGGKVYIMLVRAKVYD